MFHLPIPISGNSKKTPLKVLKRQSQGYEYHILQYEWDIFANGEGQEPYTLITNAEETKIFAYMAPKQTADKSVFRCMGFDDTDMDDIQIKPAIEGTMVTFFWNEDIEKWEVCTRNGVGCNYSFMRPTFKHDTPVKTFRQMIMDVFRENMSENANDIDDVLQFSGISKTHCFTCIMQHPENHIVYNIDKPNMKIVSIYERGSIPPLIPFDSDINYNDCMREVVDPRFIQYIPINPDDSECDDECYLWRLSEKVFGRTSIPAMYLKSTEQIRSFTQELFERHENTKFEDEFIQSEDLVENIKSVYYPTAWILTNLQTGQKCEVANPYYENAKILRNMQPNLRYLYIALRKNNTVDRYLSAFPRYRNVFEELNAEYEQFITDVYQGYVKYYILKTRNEPVPKHHFVHAARIHHGLYLNPETESLFEFCNGISRTKRVTRKVVNEYFRQFTPSKLFYFITNTNTPADETKPEEPEEPKQTDEL